MNDDLRVSIIIPVYNAEKTLKRCLDSIIEQTYKNLEIIIIDDGSTDGSRSIYEYYSNKDNRFKIIRGKNRGLSYVRNVGFNIAQGDGLFFIDSDDYVDSEIINILVGNMLETDADIVIAGYSAISNDLFKAEVTGKYQVLTKYQALKKLVDEKIPNYYWGRLYKRHVFNGIICPEGHIYEDIYTMHNVFLNAGKVSLLSDKLYAYYLNNNSLSSKTSYTFIKSCDYYYAVRKRYLDLIKYDEFSSIVLKQLVKRYLSVVRRYALEFGGGNIEKYRELIAIRNDMKNIYLNKKCKLDINFKVRLKLRIAIEHIDQYISLKRMVNRI